MARSKKGSGKGKKGQSKSQVSVTVVPTQGESATQQCALPKGGTVGQVLKSGGISAAKKDLLVNGSPATTDTKLAAGDKLTVTERPQGS